MKSCSTCKENKPFCDFNKKSARNDGYSGQCRSCHKSGKYKRTPARICTGCGVSYIPKYKERLYCTFECAAKHIDRKFGSDNPSWNGGKTVSTKGYLYVSDPAHHRAHKSGYVKYANLVAERMLGRDLLPDEVVHHKNHDRSDDSEDNLMVVTNIEHALLHGKERFVPEHERLERKSKSRKHRHIPPKERPLRKPKVVPNLPDNEAIRQMLKTHSLRELSKILNVSHVTLFHRKNKYP